jgi:hypothetical protein
MYATLSKENHRSRRIKPDPLSPRPLYGSSLFRCHPSAPLKSSEQVAAELIENRIYFWVWIVAAVSWDSARGVHLASVLASLEKSARTNMIAPGAVVAQFSVN